jgi:adenylylsulfate kinase
MSFTLWFMGLPASGKSTLAKRVENILRNDGFDIENLDGDELRKNLHPDLGFSREDRMTNNRRTAYIGRLLNRNGIATIVAMITPFREAQQQVRQIISPEGDVVLIYVKCPVEVCADRDPKGLYKQAREGKIENFTGVNHPFQEPLDPDIIVDTERNSPDECVEEILDALETRGILRERVLEDYRFDLTHSEENEILERLRERGYIE